MGDAYLAVKLGDRIGTEGVVEEGWEIGQLLELNGSMRSQGWYPPAYVGDIKIAKSDWDSSAFGKAAYESQKQEV